MSGGEGEKKKDDEFKKGTGFNFKMIDRSGNVSVCVGLFYIIFF